MNVNSPDREGKVVRRAVSSTRVGEGEGVEQRAEWTRARRREAKGQRGPTEIEGVRSDKPLLPLTPCHSPFLQGSWGAKRFQIFPDHTASVAEGHPSFQALRLLAFSVRSNKEVSLTEKNSESPVKPLWHKVSRWRKGTGPAQIRFICHFSQHLLFYKSRSAHPHPTTCDAGMVPRQ